MFLVSSGSSVTKTIAEDLEVSNRVLKLSESFLDFTLKKEQELSMRLLFNCIDVIAVLPTEFGKSLIFQMFVMICGVRNKKKKRRTGFSSIIVISLAISKHHTGAIK